MPKRRLEVVIAALSLFACAGPRSPASVDGDGGVAVAGDPRCAPQPAEGVGTCDAYFAGFLWTGQKPGRCEPWSTSGCYVRGTLYSSLERCEAAHTMCP